MNIFYEYEITSHPAAEFTHVVYFCSESGECSLNQVPTGQVKVLTDILNERGLQGWELVQLSFGKEGVMAFWKRRVTPKD
ncbi:MAG: hypothetical protein HQK58_03095 [Deltaproteobacteria bacterium]|nr:hypothetical protein [Deltaproteobacteria bacterium]